MHNKVEVSLDYNTSVRFLSEMDVMWQTQEFASVANCGTAIKTTKLSYGPQSMVPFDYMIAKHRNVA